MGGKLKIAEKGDKFIVQDESGTEYGPEVSTHKEAEALLADWKAYYAESLNG